MSPPRKHMAIHRSKPCSIQKGTQMMKTKWLVGTAFFATVLLSLFWCFSRYPVVPEYRHENQHKCASQMRLIRAMIIDQAQRDPGAASIESYYPLIIQTEGKNILICPHCRLHYCVNSTKLAWKSADTCPDEIAVYCPHPVGSFQGDPLFLMMTLGGRQIISNNRPTWSVFD